MPVSSIIANIPLRNLEGIKQYSSIVSEVDSLETKRHMATKIQKTYHHFIDVQQYKIHLVIPTVRINIGECMVSFQKPEMD